MKVPPKGFEDHFRDHPKDQSAPPGRADPRPKIIFEPAKVAAPPSRDEVKSIIADLEAADLGVKNAAKEVSKVQFKVEFKTRS